MKVVVDASVAFKWAVEEDGSDAARELLLKELLAAPSLLITECANGLWLRVRRRLINQDQARAALAAIQAAPLQLLPDSDYASAAQELAFELDRTVYDALYLAVALHERAMLVTADRRFAEAVRSHAVYGSSVRVLGD